LGTFARFPDYVQDRVDRTDGAERQKGEDMRKSNIVGLMLAAIAVALLPNLAIADDWTADKLRGEVLQLVDGQWQKLGRGMVVPDSRVIRTLAFGRVTFTRGNETVDIGPNTQIQIYDEGGRRPFTTVKQYFGSVSVEAEVEQVQHFAVQTPYLAAVVKGTRFTVTSDERGASVSVQRGHVMVASYGDRSRETISVGESAKVGATAGEVKVSSAEDVPTILADEDQAGAEVAKGKSGESSGKPKGKDDDSSSNGGSGSDNGSSGKGNSGKGNSGSGNSESGNSGKGNSGHGNDEDDE
jgi:uncharacterized membrane protein YgcG